MLTTQHGVDRGCPGTEEGRDSTTNSSKAQQNMQAALQPFDTSRLTQLLKGCDPATLTTVYQQHSEQQLPQHHHQCLKQTNQIAGGDNDVDDTTPSAHPVVIVARRNSDQQQGSSAHHLQQHRQAQQPPPGSVCHSSSTQSVQEPHFISSMLGHMTGQRSTGSTGAGQAVAATTAVTATGREALAGMQDTTAGPVHPDLQHQLQQLTPAGSTAAAIDYVVSAGPVAVSATVPAADSPFARRSASVAFGSTQQAAEQESMHVPSDSDHLMANHQQRQQQQQQQQQCVEDGGPENQPQLSRPPYMQQHQVNALAKQVDLFDRQAVGQQQQYSNAHHHLQLEHSAVDASASAAAAAAAADGWNEHAAEGLLSNNTSKQQGPDVSAASAPQSANTLAVVASASASGERPCDLPLNAATGADSGSSEEHTEAAAAAATTMDRQQQQQQQDERPKRPLMPWEELEVSANRKKLPEGRTQQQHDEQQLSERHQQRDDTAHQDEQQQQLLMLQQLATEVQQHQQQLSKAEELDIDPNDPAYAAAMAAPLPPPAAAAAVPSSSDTFVMSLSCDFKVWLPELLQRKRLFEECPNCGDSLIVKYFNISCPTQAHCYNCCPQHSSVVDASVLRTASGGQVEAALATAIAAAAAAASGDAGAAAAVAGVLSQQQQLAQLALPGPLQEQQYTQSLQPAQRKQKRNKPQKLVHLEQHQGPLLLPLYHSALRGSIAAANPHDLLALHINIAGVKAFQRNNGTKPFMLLQSQVWGGNSGQRIPGALQVAGHAGPDGDAFPPQRQSQRRQGKAKDGGAAAAAAAAGAGSVECIGCRLYRAEAAAQQLQQHNPEKQLYCSLACKWQQAGLESFLMHPDEQPLDWADLPSKPLAGGGVRLGRKRKMDGIEADAFWKGTLKKGKGGKAAVAAAAWDSAAAAAAPVGQQWEPTQQLQQLQARVPKSRKRKTPNVQDVQQQQVELCLQEGLFGQQYVGMDPLHLLEAARQLSEQQEQEQQLQMQQQQHFQDRKQQELIGGATEQQQQQQHVEAEVETGQQ